MTATASPTKLGYWINDADNHFNEPPDCFERYIDPKDAELAIRSVTGPGGQTVQLFTGPAVQVSLPPGHLLGEGTAEFVG
jgi:hypothetical protein